MLKISRSTSNPDSLVVFIHGLQGNEDTWLNKSGVSFLDLLKQDTDIESRFDFAYFNYYTKLFNSPEIINNVQKIFKSIFGRYPGKAQKNLAINEIADLLFTYLEEYANGYSNIILICHSMGGLIAKSLIVNYANKIVVKKIKLLVSLAVPHNGSHLASIGKMISSNIQIGNLAPLGEDINRVNQLWINNKDNNPRVIYFQGKLDTVVKGSSSIGYDANELDIKFCDDDHQSIAKPESADSLVCKSVKSKLLSLFPPKNEDYSALNAIPFKANENILFNVYNRVNEKYYLSRRQDLMFSLLLNSNNNIWIYGKSGVGKTNLIFRNLSIVNKKFYSIDLSGCTDYTCVKVFNYVHQQLLEIMSVSEEYTERADLAGVIDSITHTLNKFFTNNECIIFEEMPVTANDTSLVNCLFSLFIKYNNKATHGVVFMCTSIANPKNAFTEVSNKIVENTKFLEIELWSNDDITALYHLLNNYSDFRISEDDVLKLVRLSKGSPRYLKTFLVNCRALMSNGMTNFDAVANFTELQFVDNGN